MAQAFSCDSGAQTTRAPANLAKTRRRRAPTVQEPQCLPTKPAARPRAAATPLAALQPRGPPECEFRHPQKSEAAGTKPERVPKVRTMLSNFNAMPHNVGNGRRTSQKTAQRPGALVRPCRLTSYLR